MSLFKVLENMNYEGYPKTYRFRIISENLGEGFKELCWFFFFLCIVTHIFGDKFSRCRLELFLTQDLPVSGSPLLGFQLCRMAYFR